MSSPLFDHLSCIEDVIEGAGSVGEREIWWQISDEGRDTVPQGRTGDDEGPSWFSLDSGKMIRFPDNLCWPEAFRV